MKKILSLSIAIIAFFSLSFNATALNIKSLEKHGLLYKISGKDLKKPSYLYGTIHIICPNDMFGMDKLNGYLDQTEQVLMELDLDDPAVMQSMAGGLAMPDGKTLKDFLTAEQYAKVDEMFRSRLGFSVDAVKNYRPMLLASFVSTSPKVLGCATPSSYDMSFSQTAVTKKKPVFGLETVAEQLAKIDKRPFAEQARELYEMAVNPQKSIDETKQTIEVYKSQNSDGLYKFIDGRLGNADFQKVMLDERNIAWIPKIEKAINEKPSFIAVGGGHLGGENGVINLLRKKGYKVEAIKL
jgi:uncharacterized protein